MLELCTELHECEKVLFDSLDGVNYLGEVNFSVEDIDKLAAMLKEIIGRYGESEISCLKGFPACVSIYLVGKGITSYQSGEFWPPVLEGIGALETRSQYTLGEIFFQLLRRKSLARVEIRGGLAYVTPILLHGGIPVSCYREFYLNLAKYILQKKLVEEDQIRNEMTVIRSNERQRLELLEQERGLQRKENGLKVRIRKLDQLIELFRKQEELKEKNACREELTDYCEYNGFLSAKEAERLAILKKKESLLNICGECRKEIEHYTADDQKLLAYSIQIEELVKGCEFYQEAREKILAFERLIECGGLLSFTISKPHGPRGMGAAAEAIFVFIGQAQIKRKEAELAKEDLEKEILPALCSVENRRNQVASAIAALERKLEELGKGDLDAGLRLFEEIRQIRKELGEAEAGLQELWPGQVPGSLVEALELEQKLGREISELNTYLDLKHRQTELEVLTGDSDNWTHLPDYREFKAAMKREMDEIESELSVLRDRKTELLAVVQSLSQVHRIVLNLAEKVENLALELPQYQEWQKSLKQLQEEVDGHNRRIGFLAGKMWPGGWKDDYSDIVLGLEIEEIDKELNRLSSLTKERNQLEESLGNYVIKGTRPGLVLWFAGILASAGLGVFLINQSNLRYLALSGGLAALVAGYRCFKKGRENLAGQEKYFNMLQQELLRVNEDLDKSKARLHQVLDGLPVPPELTASSEALLSLVRELKATCTERRLYQEKLAELRQAMAEWEAALEESAVALSAPLREAPEQVVAELAEGLRMTRLRAEEAEKAREVLEKEILPAVCSAESRRVQLEQEINKVEQSFMKLGGGDLAAGVQLVQEKRKALQELKGVKARLEDLGFSQNGGNLENALRVKKKTEQVLDNLKIYIRLKNRQVELEKTCDLPGTWHDLPDYPELIAARKAELDTLQRELESLEERKTHQLALVGSYSPMHQKILELVEGIDLDELSASKKLMDDWENSFREVVNGLSIPVTGAPGPIVNRLYSQLKQAEGKKADALAAQEILLKEVRPALDEAGINLTRVEQKIAAFELRVRELGKGDLVEGKRLLEEFRQDLVQLKEIEKELEQHTKLWHLPPGSREEAETLREEINRELSSTKRELFLVQEQLGEINSPFTYVSEPVQRFVIYGGEWAIKWLWAGTALLRHCLGEAMDLTPVRRALPERVLSSLAEVAGDVKMEVFQLEERFARPEIVFDPSRGELKMAVGGYSFQIFSNESWPEIFVRVVSGEATPAWSAEINLRGYLTGGMVEVPRESISIPRISREYLVSLTIGEKSRTWRLQAYEEVPCLIFSEKGKMIDPERLAEQRAWLLFRDNYSIINENAVISSCVVYFDDSRYHQVLVNFLLDPVLTLVGEDGVVYEISSSEYELPLQPFLSCEETAAGLWADGKRAIYTGAVPKLKVPFDEEKSTNDWTLQVVRRFTGEVTEKLINIQRTLPGDSENQEEYFEINLVRLNLLGPNPLGEYTIVLSQGGLSEYQFEMVFFPDLMVFFEQKLYFPPGEKGAKARLTVVVPEALGDVLWVRARKPAQLTGKDGDEYYVSIDLEHDTLQMEIYYMSEGKSGRTLVTVEIPKVYWRITGAGTPSLEEWSQYYQEIWHKACCSQGYPQLEVKLPACLSNYAERYKIILEGSGHRVTAKTGGRLLRFPLAGLADSLRGGKDVYSLWFAAEDTRGRNIVHGKLLDLRCRWRVENFQYEVEERLGQWLFKATWVDLGEEQDRVVRLWPLWEPWTQPLVFPVPDGSSRLDFSMNTAEVQPGPYLLSFGVDDQWAGEGYSDEFPCDGEYSEIIYICGDRGHILVDECVWEKRRKLWIKGCLAGRTSSKKVILRLYGIRKGEFTVFDLETPLDENGNFDLFVELPKTTNRPHWLGIITEEQEPLYHFQVLPEPGRLSWPLARVEAFAEQAGLGGRIYIESKIKNLEGLYLNKEQSRLALQAWRSEKEQYVTTIQIGSQQKKVELIKRLHHNEATIKLDTGTIRCTFCGRIEPNQRAWDQKHYPRCKSFLLNFREMKASLYWEWDVAPVLATINKYSLCGNHLLVLYNNLFRPLPGDLRKELCSQDTGTATEALIGLLWKKEMELLKEMDSLRLGRLD